MKKTILILLAVLLVCASAGCIAEEGEELPDKPETYPSEYVEVYIDESTGVEYLIYSCYNKGGICPRYNADGTLKINEDYL